MTTHHTLESIDAGGAVREAAEQAGAMRSDRRELLRRGALVGGGAVAATAFFGEILSPAQAAIVNGKRSAGNDVAVLKYALLLEQLESAFYLQAVRNIKFSVPEHEFFARVVAQHEKDHVNTLATILGRKAAAPPTFAFGAAVTDEKMFLATSQILEDTGVAAYAGQGGNLKARSVVIAALSIHSVEARHAAWVRYLLGGFAPGSGDKAPAPVAFDAPLTERKVLAAVGSTGFIAG
ncbi:MAG: ferritin-like domain-containing protein [Solirubrobacteraceae bacterium]|nr:ferritin-like domain-containing protein [Solirubrobacteraceae bacterium]